MRKLFLLCGFLVLFAANASAADIYVSQSGAGAQTGANCSTARSVAWLNTAANWGGGGGEVDPGDVVHLCGTFTVSAGQNVITIQGSGSAGTPITILFESGASLQAPYFSGYPSGGAIICSSKSYIIIDGGANGYIEATANGSALANQANTVGVRWNNCSNGEVKNLSIPNQYVRTPSSSENIGVGMGIFATNGQNIDIHHNTIDDSQYNIYYTYTGTSSQNITIRDNILSRTAACIVVGDESGGALIDNIYVLRNDCSDTFVWDSPEDYFHCDGFHMWASNTNSRYTDMVIDKNYIHGDFGGHTTSPIYASCDNGGGVGACTARITNNLVYSAVSNGTNGHIYVAYNMDAALIANNTLIGGTDQGSGISIEVNTNNVVVKNNIVSGFNSWIAVDGSSDVSDSNYNEVNCTGNLNQCVYYDAGFYTWANWKSTFSRDANSLGPTSAPNLVGHHLQAGSPGVGAGVNLNSLGFTELNTDIDAQTRPVSGVWDIGADQFIAASPVLPTLPQTTIDLTMPTQGGTVRNVASGSASDFQAKINASTCGDTIVLVAGSTYTGTFTFPNKACSGWILVQSSALASLPTSGTRVAPADAADMAKVTTNTANTFPIEFLISAHNWRLIGLEVTSTAGLHLNNLIETHADATTLAEQPSFIIIDRCYVHGALTSSVRKGFSIQGASMAVVDSYFSEFHDQSLGADSQAILTYRSPGPILIQNNFLSAASENFMCGGADPGINNVVPSDITIVGNYFWKDYANWNGASPSMIVKNLIEFKSCQRVLVDGNVFDYNWVGDQNGYAIVISPRNQDGGCNWCVVQDLTFTNNLVRHAGNGFQTTGSDGTNPSLPGRRFLIEGNVFTDINGTTWGNQGRGFLILTDNGLGLSSTDITINHNSMFSQGPSGACIYLGDNDTISNFQFTNHICLYGTYGITSPSGSGQTALTTFAPGYVYDKVVILNATGSPAGGTWPTGTLWNTTSGALFTNYAAANYQLQSGSAYRNAGTDGRDIGVWDWPTFNLKTANALSGMTSQSATTNGGMMLSMLEGQ